LIALVEKAYDLKFSHSSSLAIPVRVAGTAITTLNYGIQKQKDVGRVAG
jgi:hypothetical protein